jgi:hypothetical protein
VTRKVVTIDDPGPYEHPLRAYITVAGATGPVEIGFPAWDDVADWLTSPGHWRLGEVEAITIIRIEDEDYSRRPAA